MPRSIFIRVLLNIAGLFILLALPFSCKKIKDWTYSIESIKQRTSNPDVVKYDLHPIRISRGVYGINGTIYFGENFDNSIYMRTQIFRSRDGSGNYQLTPLQIPNVTLYDFLNKYYKKLMMKDVENCTDFLQYTEDWVQPIPPKLYYVNKCVFLCEQMPDHMQKGYYKIVVSVTGPTVEAGIEFVLIIENVL